MSRDELIVLVRVQAGQITELVEANEALAGKLAKLEHLLSRNSGNSSNPPSRDEDPGKPAPPEKNKRDKGGPARSRGKQPGAPGSHLGWTDDPDERRDRFPQGCCGCGDDLGAARELGIVDRDQQHEIPPLSVTLTSTTSTRCSAAAERCTPPTGPRAPGPGRSGTARYADIGITPLMPTCRLCRAGVACCWWCPLTDRRWSA